MNQEAGTRPTKEMLQSSLVEAVRSQYPDLHNSVYRLPPVHFNRIPYSEDRVQGLPVLLTKDVSDQVSYSQNATDQPPGNRNTTGQPPVNRNTTGQPPVRRNTTGQPPVNRNTTAQPPVRRSTADQPCSPTNVQRSHICPPSCSPTNVKCSHICPPSCSPTNVKCSHISPPSCSPTNVKCSYICPPSCSPTNVQPSHIWVPPSSPTNVQHSDLRDDKAQSLTLNRLEQLAKERKEAVFLISHLRFDHYMNKALPGCRKVLDFYRAKGFPLPADLVGKKNGDFDVILIHRDHGVLLGEIKSVGSNPSPDDLSSTIIKKIQGTVKQMQKALEVAKRLVSDLAPAPPPVRITFMMPFIKRFQLEQAVRKLQQQQRKAFCDVLEEEDYIQATRLCLCADEFEDTKDDHSLAPLSQWWQQTQAHLGRCQQKMTPSLYENVVARFCGPATTVTVHCTFNPRLELRTWSEAVAELGKRLSLMVLTPQQMSILNSSHVACVLTGPPGTGKSLLLVLKGLKSCCAGHQVRVVSTRPGSLAASCMIKQQIGVTLEEVEEGYRHNLPRLHKFDFYNNNNNDEYVETAVREMLTSLSRDDEVLVIMDELGSSSDKEYCEGYEKFISRLQSEVPQLHLWAACMSHKNLPRGLHQESLDVPLRCPDTVQQEVERGLQLVTDVGRYGRSVTPPPCDGPRVMQLDHSGAGHAGVWPWQCQQCGRNIANSLRELGVGSTADSTNPAPVIPALQYRDVLILTRANLQGEAGSSSPIELVAGLRDEDIPVRVVSQWSAEDNRWMDEVEQTALAMEDKVTVSHYGFVRGLERKIVVCIPGRTPGHDDDISPARLDAQNRVWAMSRCTSQLIIVNAPTQ